MARTTFSGPVASQNGFVTSTYTSTTLPVFIQGNIVYVSDLNTLAYGGTDQWYRQDTGAGLGPGGPVQTVFLAVIDFNPDLNYVSVTNNELIYENPTANPELSRIIMAMSPGKVFEFVCDGVTYSVTTVIVNPALPGSQGTVDITFNGAIPPFVNAILSSIIIPA